MSVASSMRTSRQPRVSGSSSRGDHRARKSRALLTTSSSVPDRSISRCQQSMIFPFQQIWCSYAMTPQDRGWCSRTVLHLNVGTNLRSQGVPMLTFRQLVDPTSSTYTYLLADSRTSEAVLIDPVFEQARRDAALLCELNLRLLSTLQTHCHADHVTGAWMLKRELGSQIVV